MNHFIPTGNEYVSLPEVCEESGALDSLNFLYMAQKGMIEMRGASARPLLTPFVEKSSDTAGEGEAEALPFSEIRWSRDAFWLPVFTAKAGTLSFCYELAAPLGQRGFMIRMKVAGCGSGSVRVGLRGCWSQSIHRINQSKQMRGEKRAFISSWSNDLVLEFVNAGPLFALAFGGDGELTSEWHGEDEGLCFKVCRDLVPSPDGCAEAVFFLGLGFEETAAVASVNELRYKGWAAEYARTRTWLQQRAKKMRTERLTEIYNVNQFFCVFYSTGLTLDTEQFVCVTSRSPHYYVSAAYWDRDTFLWAFPTLLHVDPGLARRALLYAFTVQWRNVGTHSRYIDGTCLEFGFELDELVAPLIALLLYTEETGDRSLIEQQTAAGKLDELLRKLEEVKHPAADLYASFQQPSDDLCRYPYLTYDNMLVWYLYRRLSLLLPDRYGFCAEAAERVMRAIRDNCVVTDPTPRFAWAVDLQGNCEVFDEPPGSLQLLPYYGFCTPDDPVWKNTVAHIRSPEYSYSFAGMPVAEIGCPHAPYPWLLSICNSLLCGYEEQALQELEWIPMDNGIACESVDPHDGSCRTGAAFATCAGFLCNALRLAAGEPAQ